MGLSNGLKISTLAALVMAIMACSNHGSDGAGAVGGPKPPAPPTPPQKDSVAAAWSRSDSKQDLVHKVQLWKSGKLVYRLERAAVLPKFVHPKYGVKPEPNWKRETSYRFLLVEQCASDAQSEGRISCDELRLAAQSRIQAGDKSIRIGDLDFAADTDWDSRPTFGRFNQQEGRLVFKPDAGDLNLSYEKTGKYDYTVKLGNLPKESQFIVFDSQIWRPNDGYTVLPAAEVQNGIENVPNARMVWFAIYEEVDGVLQPLSAPSELYLPIFVPDQYDFKLRLSYSCDTSLSDNRCQFGGEVPNAKFALDLPFKLDQRNGNRPLDLQGSIFQIDRKADKFGGGIAGFYPLRAMAYGKLDGLSILEFDNERIAQGAQLKFAWIQILDDHRTFQSSADQTSNVVQLRGMDFPVLSLLSQFMQVRCDVAKDGDDQTTRITMRYDGPFAVQPTFTTYAHKKVALGWQAEGRCVRLDVKTKKDDGLLKMSLNVKSKFNGAPVRAEIGDSRGGEVYLNCDPQYQPDIDDCATP
jgi:hypothetical protein